MNNITAWKLLADFSLGFLIFLSFADCQMCFTFDPYWNLYADYSKQSTIWLALEQKAYMRKPAIDEI